MLIQQRRIRSLGSRLATVRRGARLVCGVRSMPEEAALLRKIGFTGNSAAGECVLPDAGFGPVSRFNAHGRELVHRDQPMETAYRTVEWHWEEWHGPHREEQSKFVDVPYQRYPRTFVPPPSVELRIASTTAGQQAVVSPEVAYAEANDDLLLHTVNLFLELFGRCQIFTSDLVEVIQAPLRRLNWRVLPPGRRPWPQLRREVEPLIRRAAEGNRPVIAHRLETVNSYQPDFVAIGQAGFAGYVVFGFPALNLFVLESIYTGNATYVFDERWEELSKRTKAEVLSEQLQHDRIIHREGWEKHIAALLRQRPRR